jgi:dethiobiotin synthetase
MSVGGIDRKRKAVMVAATHQHHGKTTVTLGMVSALLNRGVKVAYQKPVGQQTVPVLCGGEELQIDRDVDIFKYVWPQLQGTFESHSLTQEPVSTLFRTLYSFCDQRKVMR